MKQEQAMLTTYRNRLPHWRMEGACYAVAFHLIQGTLTEQERDLVLNLIRGEHTVSCNIYALMIMPNHVHLVLQPFEGILLAKLMQKFKGASARAVNLKRGANGSIWNKDSYDRILRNEPELIQKVKYIYENPLRAGLVSSPELYKWWWAPEFQNGD